MISDVSRPSEHRERPHRQPVESRQGLRFVQRDRHRFVGEVWISSGDLEKIASRRQINAKRRGGVAKHEGFQMRNRIVAIAVPKWLVIQPTILPLRVVDDSGVDSDSVRFYVGGAKVKESLLFLTARVARAQHTKQCPPKLRKHQRRSVQSDSPAFKKAIPPAPGGSHTTEHRHRSTRPSRSTSAAADLRKGGASENARAHDLFLTRSLRVWMSYFRRHVNSKRGRSGGHFCQRALTLSVRHAFAAEVAQLEMYKRSIGKNGH